MSELSKISAESFKNLPDKKAREEFESYYDSRHKINLRNHVNKIVIGSLYFMSIGAASLVFIRALHVLLPPSCRWLEQPVLQTIDTIIKYGISSTLGGLFASYVKANITNEQKNNRE